MCIKKDIKKLRRECSKRGWVITVTGGAHLKWQHKNGFFFSASSPSDWRVLTKLKKQIVRMEEGKPALGR